MNAQVYVEIDQGIMPKVKMKWKTNKKLRTYVVVGLFFTQLVSLNPLGGTFH